MPPRRPARGPSLRGSDRPSDAPSAPLDSRSAVGLGDWNEIAENGAMILLLVCAGGAALFVLAGLWFAEPEVAPLPGEERAVAYAHGAPGGEVDDDVGGAPAGAGASGGGGGGGGGTMAVPHSAADPCDTGNASFSRSVRQTVRGGWLSFWDHRLSHPTCAKPQPRYRR